MNTGWNQGWPDMGPVINDEDCYCGYCKQLMTDPKKLECQHCFCSFCLSGEANSQLMCPLCGRMTLLGDWGVLGLSKPTELIPRIDRLKKEGKTHLNATGYAPAAQNGNGTYDNSNYNNSYSQDAWQANYYSQPAQSTNWGEVDQYYTQSQNQYQNEYQTFNQQAADSHPSATHNNDYIPLGIPVQDTAHNIISNAVSSTVAATISNYTGRPQDSNSIEQKVATVAGNIVADQAINEAKNKISEAKGTYLNNVAPPTYYPDQQSVAPSNPPSYCTYDAESFPVTENSSLYPQLPDGDWVIMEPKPKQVQNSISSPPSSKAPLPPPSSKAPVPNVASASQKVAAPVSKSGTLSTVSAPSSAAATFAAASLYYGGSQAGSSIPTAQAPSSKPPAQAPPPVNPNYVQPTPLEMQMMDPNNQPRPLPEEGFFSRIIGSVKNLFGVGEEDVTSTAKGTHQKVPLYAPFLVNPPSAKISIDKWARGLWFAPANFSKGYKMAEIKPMFVPFYLFSADSNSPYIANVEKGDISKGEFLTKDSIRGAYVQHYDAVLLCATQELELKEFLVRNFKDFEVHAAKKPTTELSGPLQKPLDWDIIWRSFAEKELKPVQIEKAKQFLAKQGHMVTDLTITVTFSDIRIKLLYLPFYFTAYEHEGKRYRLAVDGQGGRVVGDRPYGSGSIGALGQSLVGKLFG